MDTPRYMIDPRLESFAEILTKAMDYIDAQEDDQPWVSSSEVKSYLGEYPGMSDYALHVLISRNFVESQDGNDMLKLTKEGKIASGILKLLASYGPIMEQDNIIQAWDICGYPQVDPGMIEFVLEWMFSNNILIEMGEL